ncbi:MAG: response regulator transcription factor [Acidobacteria bacterium]|nr:response regulator transcription factor [Acidobacteriota bacterium]
MNTGPIRIIIADDHAILRDGLRRLLATEHDFRVIAEASDGREALARSIELGPDVLLLDLAMPQLSGIEVLRELARRAPAVRTVLLTAAIPPLAFTAAVELGVRGIVLKASPPDMLLQGIRAVREGQFWVAGESLASWARNSRFRQSAGLTSRELDIVSAIKAGNSNREIAAKLRISEETVKRHLSNIYGKLGVSSRLELAVLADREGFYNQ